MHSRYSPFCETNKQETDGFDEQQSDAMYCHHHATSRGAKHKHVQSETTKQSSHQLSVAIIHNRAGGALPQLERVLRAEIVPGLVPARQQKRTSRDEVSELDNQAVCVRARVVLTPRRASAC
jgi:hypothetical protein